ncbi:MAG: MBL fold metallo-hydrolase [Saccharofermentans sp.]|nr:MBL fold metallo-hydrolase [Saccharofermentans sp.]
MYLLESCSGTFLFDPSVYPDNIRDDLPSKIDAIFCTHGHFDHINAVDKWTQLFPEAQVFIHDGDRKCLSEPIYNCSSFFSDKCIYNSSVHSISECALDGIIVEETPGHSPGSICVFYKENGKSVMFTGDTLFKLGVGRSDLPGGSQIELSQSMDIFRKFPADTIVYPGHGPQSTLEFEFKFNPFFN